MGEAKRRQQRIGDGPVDKDVIDKMTAMARGLDDFLNEGAKGDARKFGFCLMIFPFADGPGRCNYMSNADRRDVVTLLKEQLARFEGQPDLKGTA